MPWQLVSSYWMDGAWSAFGRIDLDSTTYGRYGFIKHFTASSFALGTAIHRRYVYIISLVLELAFARAGVKIDCPR
jgi:hypothetical protein